MSDTQSTSAGTAEKKPVIIWADGCFDMMHFGHANALRQAKSVGDYLIVGVHSDAEIERYKGPTVMNEQERYEAVRACKWVDLVVEDAPYVTDLAMLNKYNVDYCVHGEDITVDENGNNTYQAIIDAGKFKIIKRTEGVSTTDIVGRMLLLTKSHFAPNTSTLPKQSIQELSEGEKRSPYTGVSCFLPTSKKITQFSSAREPKEGDTIVYLDGGFDLFHVGHVGIFKKVKEHFGANCFLIVGIHDDNTINYHKGSNFPIMNLHERVLSVLSCRYVDEVIIGAPYIISKDMIDSMKINFVAHGTVMDAPDKHDIDPYALPKQLGIYVEIESPMPQLTSGAVIDRIIKNRREFEERNAKKEAKELKLVEQKNV